MNTFVLFFPHCADFNANSRILELIPGVFRLYTLGVSTHFVLIFLGKKHAHALSYTFLPVWYSVKIGQHYWTFRQTPTDLKMLGWEYLCSPGQ